MRPMLFAVIALLLGPPAAQAVPNSPGRIEFEVLRNGQPFGRHVVTVTAEDGVLTARTEVALRVSAGPVTFFHYEHACSESWRDAQLLSLECSTLKQGRRFRVRAARRAEGLIVAGDGGESVFGPDLRPTSWWTRPPVGAEAMLDTETGARMPLRVTRVGAETISIAGARVEAERIRVEGALVVDLWYDTQGRWVGCAFTARGQRIEYRLISPRNGLPA